MSSKAHDQAWEDWGTVNPLFGILTDPRYRDHGDVEEFLRTGEGAVESILDTCRQLCIAESHRSALDFGCGVGRLSWALAAQFEDVVGLDIAESMVSAARQMRTDRHNCVFKVNRSDDLATFEGDSFDLVLCFLVLQHLASADAIIRFLAEFVRVLRPGGALVVQLPSRVPAHRPPLPPFRTRSGLRTRLAIALRKVGVPPNFLYRRLSWVPEMTMLALPEEVTVSTLEAAGGKILDATPRDIDSGGTVSRIYYVTK